MFFEDIVRSKIHHAIKTKQNFDELVQNEGYTELPQLKRDLANFFEHYLDIVNLLINIYFPGTNNWERYIEASRKFLPYCFPCNHHNYARNLWFYYIQMKKWRPSYPSAHMFLKEEVFTVLLTGKPHSKIPMDQVIEMTIAHQKKPVI